MKKSYLFISCDEAKDICNRAQYGEATNWEKTKLSFRLFWCKITKCYFKRNIKLTKTVDKAHIKCLSPEERHNLNQKFQDCLSKEQP